MAYKTLSFPNPPLKNDDILRFPVLTKLCNVLKECLITSMFCDDLLSSQHCCETETAVLACYQSTHASVLVGS